MSAAHFRGDTVVTGRGSNAVNFIGGDAHADAGAANQDTAIDALFSDGLGDLDGEIGIIHAFRSVGAEVQSLVAELFEEKHDSLLGLKSSMVAADGNFHGTTLSHSSPSTIILLGTS